MISEAMETNQDDLLNTTRQVLQIHSIHACENGFLFSLWSLNTGLSDE